VISHAWLTSLHAHGYFHRYRYLSCREQRPSDRVELGHITRLLGEIPRPHPGPTRFISNNRIEIALSRAADKK
jgi:hypothetical protein